MSIIIILFSLSFFILYCTVNIRWNTHKKFVANNNKKGKRFGHPHFLMGEDPFRYSYYYKRYNSPISRTVVIL